MAVASGVLAVVIVKDANGAERRVVISTDTPCDLQLLDHLLRLRQTAKSYGATLRLEDVHPALLDLLELVGVRSRFQRRVSRGAQAAAEHSTR
jgi:hypothetical protein